MVAILAFFGFFNVYSLRVNLSIGIVAMTENKSITLEDGNTTYVGTQHFFKFLLQHLWFFFKYLVLLSNTKKNVLNLTT